MLVGACIGLERRLRHEQRTSRDLAELLDESEAERLQLRAFAERHRRRVIAYRHTARDGEVRVLDPAEVEVVSHDRLPALRIVRGES